MSRTAAVFGVVLCAASLVQAQRQDPFDARVALSSDGVYRIATVRFTVPPRHHLYADTIHVEGGEGIQLVPVRVPPPVPLRDDFSAGTRDSYTNDVEMVFDIKGVAGTNSDLIVRYQGCDETTCFFPQTRRFPLYDTAQMGAGSSGRAAPDVPATRDRVADFTVSRRAFGYVRKTDFLAFLDSGGSQGGQQKAPRAASLGNLREALALFAADPVEFIRRFGSFWTALLIVLGGMMLNLTPCVLPMIPINLAIIGAGSQGAGRRRGFLLGGVYGLGIAAVYGVLGVLVVLTGAQFGALNSKPLFNVIIAMVFGILGLAMFDVFPIDFSRFQPSLGSGGRARGGSYIVACAMGGVAALLAGACVAPVVIAVLVLSGALYSHGIGAGILLPFLLGVGMALPWPFAGSGLSFLPKPGKWMTWVKYGFGVFILSLGAYYAFVAYEGLRGAKKGPAARERGVFHVSAAEGLAPWRAALEDAKRGGKPVFVDFWATWCKNCEAMDASTFRDEGVRARLKEFIVVKCQAEDLGNPATRSLLDRFGVKGLPTYLVLRVGREPERGMSGP